MVELFEKLFMNRYKYSPFSVWGAEIYTKIEINLRLYEEDNTYKIFIDRDKKLSIYHKYNIKELHVYKTKELLNILEALW